LLLALTEDGLEEVEVEGEEEEEEAEGTEAEEEEEEEEENEGTLCEGRVFLCSSVSCFKELPSSSTGLPS
jgi:hypothetical protein